MTKIFTSSKKGNAVLDTAVVIGVLIIFAIVTITGYYIWTQMSTEITNETNNSWVAGNLTEMTTDRYPSVFDGIFVFVFIMLWIMVIIASFLIDTHPIFFGISLILLIFIFAASVMLANFFDEYFSDAEFGSVTDNFPMTVWIIEHYLMFTIGIGSTILLSLYGKAVTT